jgi:hypothetical protein
MKLKIFILLIIIGQSWLIPFSARSGKLPGITETIATAIRTGNSRTLATYFNSTIEITLPEKEGTFSKVQAEMVMKDFFAKNPPASFDVNQKGSSSGGSQFIIGTYKTGVSNKVYKTYLLLKPVDGQLLIQQLQLESN